MTSLRARLDWTVGFALMGLGAVLVVLGSVGVSRSHFASDQLAYIVSGGLGGLLLLGAGATLLITAGLSDEWRKLDRVERALTTSSGASQTPGSTVPGPSSPSAEALVRRGRLLAGAGMLITVIFLVFAWLRASGEADPEPGLEAIGTGVIGLVIGGLMAALATLWLKRHIQLRKSRLFAPWFQAETTPARPARNGRVLVAAGLTRFHLSGCPAVAGIQTREINRGQIPDGLAPCELCEAE
ncbi:MAG TPA: hypothetical protein VGL92_17330 [Acidimicrobiia bacterium]